MRRWGGIGWAAALLAWTGCASLPGPWRSGPQAGPPIVCVGDIRFVGNALLRESELESELFTREAPLFPWDECTPFDAVTFGADLDRVRERYQEAGYFGAEVTSRVLPEASAERIDLEITVVEGEPSRLRRREVELLPGSLLTAEELDAIVAKLPAQLGQPFGRLVYDRSREALLEGVGALGYLEPELSGSADVDPSTHSAELHWQLAPGPRVRVGEIAIDGPDSIDEPLLAHRLGLEPGDLLTPDALKQAQQGLADLGIFRSVRIEPESIPREPGEPTPLEATWPIAVTLELGALRRIRLGAGYGTDEGPRGFASWSHRNWLGNLRRLQFSLKGSDIEQFARASLLQPSFPDLETDLELRLGVGEEDPPAWRSRRAVGSAYLSRDLGSSWAGILGVRLSEDNLRDFPEDPAVFDEAPNPRVGALSVGLTRTDLDDPINPTFGQELSLTVDVASQALLSDTDFVKFEGRGRWYLPLGPVLLASRLAYGAIQPYASTAQADIPVVERFFAGGSVSVRGYDYQELPPDDPDGDPLGGLTWLEGSVELRVPVWRELQGVAFLDAGVIDVRSFTVDFGEVLYAAGVGARYATPVGPLRLDVGFPLNRPEGFDAFRVHVSVGHVF